MSAPVHPPGFELNRLIDRLAECDAQSGAVAPDDSTVANLKAQLDTLSEELAKPEPVDPFTEESACRRVVEIVAAIGKDPTFVTATSVDRKSLSGEREAGMPASIGQYRILSQLGVGGMGAVYKALHTKLEKVVALKVLPADRLKDPGAVARFEREMRAVGKLHHPNIVAAHDAGEIGDTHYLVMELVEGIDIGTLLKERGCLPVADACEMIRQAALGLQHAHEHGLVHRDIKPSNLMLAERQGSRVKSQGSESTSPLTLDAQPLTVKILDLGLALLDNNQRELAGELTSTGQIMGTLDYMAPEQGSDTHAVDIRADVYSLGATLYKLLAGRAPFEGPQYNTPMKKLTALATAEPQPVRELRPDVPPELAAIVHRLLAKSPQQRPTPPAAVADLLRPFAAGADFVRLLHGDLSGDGATLPAAESATEPTVVEPTDVAGIAIEGSSIPVVAPATTATEPRPRARQGVRVRTLLKLAALVVPLALITIQTKQGTVTIDSDERLADDVEIVVTSGDEVLILSKSNGWKVRARAGEYHVEVRGGNDQFKVEKNRLGVSRWGTTIVDIRFDEPQEAVAARVNPTSAAANFALQFDGVDDYVKIPNPPDWQSGPLTIEAFVTMAETGPRLSCVVRAAALKLRLHRTAPQWMFMAYDDPDTELTGDDRLATLGRRVLLAGVWDQATLSLYVDGEFRGRSPIHKGFKLLDPLSDGYIGASPASNAQDPRNHEGLMHGTIDEVRISDFVRYTENFPPAERFERDEHTLALYHFDEGEGDVLHDASGNGHDGKIVGATWVPLQSPSHDRAVADWVVARGGRVLLRMHDGGDIFRGTGEPLPDGPFQVRSIDLNGKQVADDDLARISGLSGLVSLHLNQTMVTDAGLDHIARIETLQFLDLDGTSVGSNGLEPLGRLTSLRRLSVTQTSFYDDCAKVFSVLGHL
jgi:serine/threonine protein kinase